MEVEEMSIQALDQPCQKLISEQNETIQQEQSPQKSFAETIDVNFKATVSQVSLKGMIPEIGMEFESGVDAYNFYNSYAKEIGFSIRRERGHKDYTGRVWLDRSFCCSREGTRAVDKKDNQVKCHRVETRCNCSAMMKVSARISGKYRIVKFIQEHTHQLATPRKSMFLRSHRKINACQATEVEMSDQSGITPKMGIAVMAKRVGRMESLGIIPGEYKNYLCSKRMEKMKVGDTGGVLEYLQHMQSEDPNFSYAIQVDADDLITNIFWADARMKLDYECFGDVVCFDTTCKLNKEGRPLALFVGVNHHKQSIVFGVALLYDETCESFVWIFDTFMMVMSGKKSTTILTDQNAVMTKALRMQWQETHHRLCIWHIHQNAAKHLSHVFDKFESFAHDFSCCVYEHGDEDDFLNAWRTMIDKYELENNSWLQTLFELKEQWALVYGGKYFCADMSTTQRSESMNSQVKHYISYKCDLLHFFSQFQRLMDDKRFEELKADFKATQSVSYMHHQIEILKHVAGIYTPAVFKVFSEQVFLAWDCQLCEVVVCGSVKNYKVVPPDKPRYHMVSFDSLDTTISCSCKKFELAGILCSHALKVFSLHGVRRLPERYILKRWKKDAKGASVNNSSFCTTPDLRSDVMSRYKLLLRSYANLAAKAALSECSFDMAMADGAKTLNEVVAQLGRLTMEEHVKLGNTHQAAEIVPTNP